MRITESNLRRIIREVMSNQDAEEKYGKVLFGVDRCKTAWPGIECEPNTPDENELRNALKKWYAGHGSFSISRKDVRTIADLIKTGLYDDVLALPSGPQKAYRMIKLRDEDTFRRYAGEPISPSRIRAITDEELRAVEDGRVEIRALKPGSTHDLYGSLPAASWSTNVFSVADFNKLSRGRNRGIAYLKAIPSKTPGAFVLNPDNMAPIAGSFAGQSEILQISPSVPLSGGIVVWAPDPSSTTSTLVDDIATKAILSSEVQY